MKNGARIQRHIRKESNFRGSGLYQFQNSHFGLGKHGSAQFATIRQRIRGLFSGDCTTPPTPAHAVESGQISGAVSGDAGGAR